MEDQASFATKVAVDEMFVDLTNHINDVELTPGPQGEKGDQGNPGNDG
jgi:hypothetical protein